MDNESRIQLNVNTTLIKTEEGIYFLKVAEVPPVPIEPSVAASLLLKMVQNDTARLIARNLVAWDTSKDKREGMLPEVYLSNKVWYQRITGEEYLQHKAIERFRIE